jgi:hypothetical protein
MEKTRNATQLALAKQCDIDVPESANREIRGEALHRLTMRSTLDVRRSDYSFRHPHI